MSTCKITLSTCKITLSTCKITLSTCKITLSTFHAITIINSVNTVNARKISRVNSHSPEDSAVEWSFHISFFCLT